MPITIVMTAPAALTSGPPASPAGDAATEEHDLADERATVGYRLIAVFSRPPGPAKVRLQQAIRN